MQTVILIIVLHPPLSEESRSYMLTTCMHFGVLDYERTFLKTQPRKDLALLLECQKSDVTVVDCHWLGYGIKARFSHPWPALLCCLWC